MVGLLESFLEPLGMMLPAEELLLEGAWSTAVRRTYARAAQAGTGEGPYVEVVDARWRGAVSGSSPLVGVAFRLTADGVAWSRSQPPAAALPVDVSLHACAEPPGGASLAVTFHGAMLPSVPVVRDERHPGWPVGEGRVVTGRLHVLVTAGDASFAVVLLSGTAVEVARNRIWHLREELARSLPEPVQRLMTRARSGVLRPSDLAQRGA